MLKLLNIFLGRASGRIDFSLPGGELLLIVYERLKSLAPSRPNQAESSMKLIQEDLMADELMPLAVAIIALKKSSISAGYTPPPKLKSLSVRTEAFLFGVRLLLIGSALRRGGAGALRKLSAQSLEFFARVFFDRVLVQVHLGDEATGDGCNHVTAFFTFACPAHGQ